MQTTDFRHPRDGWYMIEPKGDHRNGGLVQVIDDIAAKSIVNKFNAEAANPSFPGMLVDHEHFKHDANKETVAYGWLMALENRRDGIYGRIRWTKRGKEAVDGGDYRFFSTEYDRSGLDSLGGDRMRPIELAGLTLTNTPNNVGGDPITNSRRPANSAERASCLTIEANAIKNRTGCTFDAAWNQAIRNSHPGLSQDFLKKHGWTKHQGYDPSKKYAPVLIEGGSNSAIQPIYEPTPEEIAQQQADEEARQASDEATKEQQAQDAELKASMEAVSAWRSAYSQWFQTVHDLGDSSAQNDSSAPALDFFQRWNIAKRMYPELFEKAFGPLCSSDGLDLSSDAKADFDTLSSLGPQMVQSLAGTMTNRVQADSGWKFDQVLEFCNREAPLLFNRLRADSARRPLALPSSRADTANDQRSAASEVQTLVNKLRTERGYNFERAWTEARRLSPAIFNRLNA